ncbi:MAG: hypothetical protein PHE52_00965 [Candidatus Pacebacteria bacterium]|nr:hypothetical protein [Candidatus Paceibacterota bacterium]
MIIGHRKQWAFLKKAAQFKKFSHAYLFCGQEKLGKKKIALEWISLLFGKPVVGMSAEEYNPDLIFIEPQAKEIQISQIRDLIWRLSLKPSVSSLKVAVINDAHLMNAEAQSSLLKTLEEPRGDALLILISDKTQYLFPTILSRVQTIKFHQVQKEEINNYLMKEGISREKAEEIAEVSSGRPGVALDIVSGKEKLEDLIKKIQELDKLSQSSLCSRFQYAKDLSDNSENVKNTLDIWLDCFRNILLSHFSPSDSGAVPQNESFKKYPISKLKKIINLIQTTKLIISSTNVNLRLALETLMLEI